MNDTIVIVMLAYGAVVLTCLVGVIISTSLDSPVWPRLWAIVNRAGFLLGKGIGIGARWASSHRVYAVTNRDGITFYLEQLETRERRIQSKIRRELYGETLASLHTQSGRSVRRAGRRRRSTRRAGF
jgi:hypothetical protein